LKEGRIVSFGVLLRPAYEVVEDGESPRKKGRDQRKRDWKSGKEATSLNYGRVKRLSNHDHEQPKDQGRSGSTFEVRETRPAEKTPRASTIRKKTPGGIRCDSCGATPTRKADWHTRGKSERRRA